MGKNTILALVLLAAPCVLRAQLPYSIKDPAIMENFEFLYSQSLSTKNITYPAGIYNQNTLQAGSTAYPSSFSVDGQTLLARNSGNVGIGTATPVDFTHIFFNNASNRGLVIENANAGDAAGSQVRFKNAVGNISQIVQNSNTNANANYLVIDNETSSAGISFLTDGGSEKMRITGAGRVGVGTTAPVNQVAAVGGGHFTSSVTASDFYSLNGGTFTKVVVFNGRVGIGTNTPVDFAHIFFNSASNVGLVIENINTDAAAAAQLKFRNAAGKVSQINQQSDTSADANYLLIDNETSGAGIAFLVNGGIEKMRLEPAGDLGVGTTAPDTSVHIGRTDFATTWSIHGSTGPTGAQGGYVQGTGRDDITLGAGARWDGANFESTSDNDSASIYIMDGGTYTWYSNNLTRVPITNFTPTSRMTLTPNGDLTIDSTGYADAFNAIDVIASTFSAKNGPARIYLQEDVTISTGHVITGGLTPTVSGCGGSPSIVGTDMAGRVTVGSTGAPTACSITFKRVWATAPVCTCAFVNTNAACYISSSDTATHQFRNTANGDLTSTIFNYICLGF